MSLSFCIFSRTLVRFGMSVPFLLACSFLGFSDCHAADTAEATTESESWLLDPDIESENDRSLGEPAGTDWEDHIEADKYAIGKILLAGEASLTPLRIRLNRDLLPPGIVANSRISLDLENASGSVVLWRSQAEDVDSRVQWKPGTEVALQDLELDESTASTTVWL